MHMTEHAGLEYPMRLGLAFDPFLKNAKEVFLDTDDAREAMHRLDLLADIRGFGLLTGESGTGKTTVTRNWCRGLNPSLFKVFYSSLSTLTVMEFYRNLTFSLGQQPAYRKSDNFHLIQNEITRLYTERHITPVFVVDEANHINSGILNDFKILFNFDMDSQDRAVILLVSSPQIHHVLKLTAHESLRQRIAFSYNLCGLNKAEGKLYIESKLKHAGATQPIFTDNALEALLNKANGIPRVLNNLCSRSMLFAAQHSRQQVEPEDAIAAIDECELS